MAMDSPAPARLSPGGLRLVTIAGLMLGLGALCSCFGSDGISQLFGDETTGGGGGGRQGGFDPGLGGGVILRDLFQGARIEQAVPSVTSTYPANGDTLINVKSVIVIEFSESVDAQTALGGIRVFSAGSAVAVPGQISLFQGQTVALFTPNADLVPATSYEIAVSNSVTDLQGKQIDTGGAADRRFQFTTQAQTDDPGFKVGLSSPRQSQGNVPRDAEAVIFFTEPANSTTGPAGLFGPGNITVDLNGGRLQLAVDYTQTAIGGASLMGVQIQFNAPLVPAGADVDIQVSDRVETADGLHTLAGGDGFRLRWTAQNAQTPNDIQFPNTFALPNADGFVAKPNLNAFLADVVMTADGQGADDVTILFFDASQNNALVFEASGGNPLRFNVNLQPDPATPAFNDGDIVVGAFIRRGTFRSSVSVLRILRKDTIGPVLQFLGPPTTQVGVPPFGVNVFYTYVNDPILYGTMDEPCEGIQVEFNESGLADFSSIQFAAGRSTVTDDYFFTGPTRDGPLDPQLEPHVSFAVIATDQLGNGNIDLTPAAVATVGVTGARWASPDGNSALVVSATDMDDFINLGAPSSNTWGMVVVDRFPPDPSGADQQVKGLQASSGLARFLDSELPPTPKITVTVVSNDDDNQNPTFWNVVTYAGIDKPTSGNPLVLLPLLEKASPDAPIPVQVNVTGGVAGAINVVGSSDADLNPSTAQGERMVVLANSGDSIPAGENRPQVITGVETATNSDQRYSSTEPYAEGDAPAAGGGGGGQLTPTQTLDFTGRVSYNPATPDLAFNLSFDNVADLVGTGLKGSEADQYRRARLLVRAPGLVVPPAVSITIGTLFDKNVTLRTATLLKPVDFLVNDTIATTGHEDSALELFLQPDLADPTTAVDDALQDQMIRSELHIQDTIETATGNPHSAFVRQRFFTDLNTQSASFQTVPTVTASSLTHPPVLDWPEVTGGTNAVHSLDLVDAASGRSWRIYVPAGTLGDPIMFQVPLIPGNFVDTSAAGSRAVPFEFSDPGTYNVYVESYDFDPAAGTATYQFDFNQFYQSDLEREHFHLSRSDTNLSITTTP